MACGSFGGIAPREGTESLLAMPFDPRERVVSVGGLQRSHSIKSFKGEELEHTTTQIPLVADNQTLNEAATNCTPPLKKKVDVGARFSL